MQKPNVPVQVQGPFAELLKENPVLGWVAGGVAILILVAIGYYLIDIFRRQITEDPNNEPAQKLSELEQLKSTAYPELAEFRKIKQMRMPNDDSSDGPNFEEIDD